MEGSLDLRTDPSAPLLGDMLARLGLAPRHALCLDATPPIMTLPALAGATRVAVQGWRPAHDALVAAGIATAPALADADIGFDAALVRIGRSRVRNLAALAEGLLRLAPGGTLLAAGPNDCGPASHARLVGATASLSRLHARAFALPLAAAPASDLLERWRDAARIARVAPDGHFAAPGAFAADRIDRGSALLAACLPGDVCGRVADLGAGWGFLTMRLRDLCPGIAAIDLYEADHASLEAARRNLPELPGAAFHWADVVRGLPRSDYDAIVANPPFHDDRAADSAIGRAFVVAAAAALRPGGRLWMVANRRLPYEETLRASFARVAVLREGEGYKVIAATR
jgi:16S rRNA (guanine1207-N2)-methyltransferase